MSCPFSTISFVDFFAERRRPNGLFDRMPVYMGIELTQRCNMKCVHCYMQDPETTVPAVDPAELSTAEVEKLIDDAAEMGVLWVLFTGGDPLAHPDFERLYMHAKRVGMFVCVFTNGTLITERIADMFADYPPTTIEVTVHSMDPAVFDSITRVPGSFMRCMAGIDRLVARGLTFSIKSIALEGNYRGLDEVEAFAKRLEVPHRFDSNVLPLRGTGAPPEGQRLSPETVVELDRRSPERMASWSELQQLCGLSSNEQVYSCGAGLSSFWVDSAGRLSMCALTGHVTYDLRQGSLREAWTRFIPDEILRKPTTDYPCGGCEFDAICGRCPGWSAAESGRIEAPVPYLCEVAQLRYDAILEYRAAEYGATIVDPETPVGHLTDSSLSNQAVPFEDEGR